MGGGLSKKAKAQIALSKKTGGTEVNLSDCNVHKIGSFKSITRLKLLRRLNLSRNFLTVIPTNVKALVNLEELDVSFNQLQDLPTELCTLSNLKVLILEGNLIPALPTPSQFGLMSSLQVLNLSSNKITTLSDDFAELPALTHLALGHNDFQNIPPQIFRLRSLKILDLSGNNLNLTDQLTKLTGLETLDISKCNLVSLPTWIGEMTSLQQLYIQNNRLTALPDEICQLTKLKRWNGGGNLFTQLDNLHLGMLENMEELLFAECQLDHFPHGLGRMTNLRVLDLTGNQLTVLPREVGWLDQSMRKLLAGNNKLVGVPGELSFLNPAIELDLGNNPFKPPYIQWYQEGIIVLMENLKPFLKAYPPYCYAHGNALSSGMAGVPASFDVQALDKMHNPRLNGGDEFQAVWIGEKDGQPVTQKGIVKDNKDGTYTVFYNFTVSGKFEVHITESGEEIKDSPFAAYIQPAQSDVYDTMVSGEGLSKGKVGVPCPIDIQAKDKFGNRQDRGGEPFQLKVTGPSGAAPKAVIDDTGTGVYHVTWTAGWEGVYTVHIFYDSTPLNGSPYTVTISS